MSKKPGPPVPPRPSPGIIKSRSESPISSFKKPVAMTASTTKITTSVSSSSISASPSVTPSSPTSLTQSPIEETTEAGRTVIYKSPSFDQKKRQQQLVASRQSQFSEPNFTSAGPTCNNNSSSESCLSSKQVDKRNSMAIRTQSLNASDTASGDIVPRKTNRTEIVIINNNSKSAVIDTSNNVTPTRANSVRSSENNSPVSNKSVRIEAERKISPVPKPRTNIPSKIESYDEYHKELKYKNDINDLKINQFNINNNRSTSEITINNNQYEEGYQCNKKTVEIENNLKNAAERLFTEIIINQAATISKTDESLIDNKSNDYNLNHKVDNQHTEEQSIKTEHCISVRSTPSPTLSNGDSPNANHKNRTCISLLQRPEPEGGENKSDEVTKENPAKDDIEDKIPPAKKVAFHELLISELTAMRRGSFDALSNIDDHDDDDSTDMNKYDNYQNYSRSSSHSRQGQKHSKQQRKRYPSGCSTDSSPYGTQRSRIRTSDWVEVGDNGKEVMFTSCHISLEDSGLEDEERLDDTSSGVGDSWDSAKDVEERMSLPGLPPLPKSLSGLELTGVPVVHNSTGSLASLESQRGVSPMSRMTGSTGAASNTSTLDTQLAILRREMFGLRQLDLSLLSQLWALNESIQEFRTMLQEQEALSPPSPSPSPSDVNSVSSGDEEEILPPISTKAPQLPAALQRMRAAPPPPPPARKAPQRPV